jgi:hypothetical protein
MSIVHESDDAFVMMSNIMKRVMPLVMEATGSVGDYMLIMEMITSACCPPQVLQEKYKELIERCQVRFKEMVKVGMFEAFTAILHSTNQLHSPKSARLTVATIRNVCTNQTNWTAAARQASLIPPLIDVLKKTCHDLTDVDAACSILTSLLINTEYRVVLDAHRKGATNACLYRLGYRVSSIRLLSELVRCNSVCRHIMRQEVRARRTLDHIYASLDMGNRGVYHGRYLAAVDAFCRLVDNDIVRTTALLPMQGVAQLVVHQLQQEVHVHAVRLLRTLVGKGISCFLGQAKESRRPSALQVRITASKWSQALGNDSIEGLLCAVKRTPTTGVWRMTLMILQELSQHVALHHTTAMEALSCMCELVQRTKDVTTLRKILYTCMQVCLSAGIDAQSHLSLVNACSNATRKADFNSVCRGDCFYHAPAKVWNSTDTCTVCLEKLDENVQETSCKHVFHEECLLKWLEVSEGGEQCPVCRSTGLDVVDVLLRNYSVPPITPQRVQRRVRSRNRL